jgi:hypothetical protein
MRSSQHSKEAHRGYAKVKTTQKKLIWVDFLISGYMKWLKL